MRDDLAWVEHNYGCVAEYNRQRDEADAEQYEREMRALENCKRNKAKLDAAGERAMMDCEDCYGCRFYEDVGPTYIDSWGYQDDFTHGICHHKGTPYKDILEPFCKGKEEGDYTDEQTT